jgi:hypothetical protein
MDSMNSQYYILVAGRWFSSPSIASGPWSFIAADTLPPDFAKIPPYSPKASVLASIPGTPQAKEALIANQIPQTATIRRTGALLNLTYLGSPDFQPITGTSMTYAVNSATPVIYVPGGSYYACQGAVWFAGGFANGPWTVATSVPDIIYSIPTSSPIYNVTYVRVYGYTPSVVYVGYTPGYYGTVVSSDGVVVYGTGYVYSPFVTSTVWVPAPVTYGVGASFGWSAVGGWALGFGIGMAIGTACSPWWGPSGWYGWGMGAPAWGWGTNGNNLYADHDGNVYKANPTSGWQKYSNGSWNNVDKPTQSSLNSQFAARDQGTQRWNNFRSGGWGGSSGRSGGWGDGRFHGGWGGGGFGGFRR